MKMQSAQLIACSKIITLHLLQSRQATNIYGPHKGVINSVHINHTNKVIASCGQDGRIVLVNAQRPDHQVFQTNFHTGNNANMRPVSVNCVMFSKNSYYIAAGSSDSLIKIWDMKSHKNVYLTLDSHNGSITSLGWIKNSGFQKTQGQILASSSACGDIFLHSVKNGNVISEINLKTSQPIHQIKILQSEKQCKLAAGTNSGIAMVWDVRNIKPKDNSPYATFSNGKKSSITSLSFSQFNPSLMATSSVDQNMYFYDIKEKKCVKIINSEQPLTNISFNSDGHTLVAGGMYGGLFVYDLRKPSMPKQKLIGHDSAIKCLVMIKQYQPSSTNISASRSSKTSSVSSSNSSKIPESSKQIKQSNLDSETKTINKQVKMNNFVLNSQNYQKRLDNKFDQKNNQHSRADTMNLNVTKTENLPGNSPNLNVSQRQNIKLSATGQQIIKSNLEMKNNVGTGNINNKGSININSHTSSLSSISGSNVSLNSNISTSNNYIIPNESRNMPPMSNGSRNKISTNNISQQSSVSPLKQPIRSNSSLQPSSNISLTNNKLNSTFSPQLRQYIDEKFQNFHMQMIRQFHHQQMQIKEMISNLLIEDKKKTQKIKQLEGQIKNLKSFSY